MIRGEPIRLLIVDDSMVIRRLLQRHFDGLKSFKVVGTAGDPFEAHEAIFRLRPDALTLDVEMPRMDGLTFLGKLMQHHPMPVVIHSSVTPANSPNALAALALGAVDVVPKSPDASGQEATLRRLDAALHAAASSHPRALASPPALPARSERPPAPRNSSIRAIGIAASTGGTQAIESILTRVPDDFPCILIVQHLPPDFVGPFADRLDAACAVRVRVARGDDTLEPGLALIAPGDRHLTLRGAEPRTRLTEGPKVNFHRPSADLLFRGMARTLGAAACGVVLTGMGRDGANGLRDMRAAGARVIAQSESSCVVYGMPRAAIENGAATAVAPLEEIPDVLTHTLAEPRLHAH